MQESSLYFSCILSIMHLNVMLLLCSLPSALFPAHLNFSTIIFPTCFSILVLLAKKKFTHPPFPSIFVQRDRIQSGIYKSKLPLLITIKQPHLFASFWLDQGLNCANNILISLTDKRAPGVEEKSMLHIFVSWILCHHLHPILEFCGYKEKIGREICVHH